MVLDTSLQEKFAPNNACFGCGPANLEGLRLRSFEKGDGLFAEWQPKKLHEAFPGVLNGGIIGALLDCHSNWTAAWYLMKARGESHPPCTVTAEYAIKLFRPTPTKMAVQLLSKVSESSEHRVVIEAILTAEGKSCAACRGVFVAVKPGHPAYHRW